jgi:hypothetical protein
MTNAQRQAKWREKNRALFNMRRRLARKKSSTAVPSARSQSTGLAQDSNGGSRTSSVETPITVEQSGAKRQAAADPVITGIKVTSSEKFPRMIESTSKPETVITRPAVYRNDFGGVISKYAWEQLQKKKEAAKKGNYTLDEYSQ